MSPIQSLYDHPFDENLTYLWGITYNPCLQALSGYYNSEDFFIWSLDHFEQELGNNGLLISNWISCIRSLYDILSLRTLNVNNGQLI